MHYFMELFYRLCDKDRGNKLELDEFPSLYLMEGHTGGCGILFTSAWIVFALIAFPELLQERSLPFLACIAAVAGVFFLLFWISAWLGNRFHGRSTQSATTLNAEENSRLGFRARLGILLLSATYAVVCAILIWLTGGPISPFIPFYIMIFTLTIERTTLPFPGYVVLAYFGFVLAITCLSWWRWSPPIAKSIMYQIQESPFQNTMIIAFLFASLIVPAVSAHFVRIKEARRAASRRQPPAT